MDGTVRTVTINIGEPGYLVAVRWDDGTLSEDVWDAQPQPGDRVTRSE